MSSIADLYGSGAATGDEQAAALQAALRRNQDAGALALLSGSKSMQPFGQAMESSANRQTQILGQAREHALARAMQAQKMGQDDRHFSANQDRQREALTEQIAARHEDARMRAEVMHALGDQRGRVPVTTPKGEHLLVDKRTGEATPVTMDGAPLVTPKMPSAADTKDLGGFDAALHRLDELEAAYKGNPGTRPGASLIHSAATAVGMGDPAFDQLRLLAGKNLLSGLRGDVGRVTDFENRYGSARYPTEETPPAQALPMIGTLRGLIQHDRANHVGLLQGRGLDLGGIPGAAQPAPASAAPAPSAQPGAAPVIRQWKPGVGFGG